MPAGHLAGERYQTPSATSRSNKDMPRQPKEIGGLEAPTPLLFPSSLLPAQAEDARKAPLAHEQPDQSPSKTSTMGPMASSCNAAHPPNPPAHLRRAKPLHVRRISSTAPKPAPLAPPTVPLPLPRISFDTPLPVISPSKWFNSEQCTTWQAPVYEAAQDLPARQPVPSKSPNKKPLRTLASPHQSSRRLTEFSFRPLAAQAVPYLKQAFATSKQTSATTAAPIDYIDPVNKVNACAAAIEGDQSVIDAPPKDEQFTAILMEHNQAYQAIKPLPTLPVTPKETGELEAPTPLLPPSPVLPAQVEDAPKCPKAPPAHKPPAKSSTKATMASSCTPAHQHASVRLFQPMRARRILSTGPKLPPLARPAVQLAFPLLPRISFDNPLPVTSPSKCLNFNPEKWQAPVASAAEDLPARPPVPKSPKRQSLVNPAQPTLPTSPQQCSRRLTGPLTAQAAQHPKQASEQTSAAPIDPVNARAATKRDDQSVIDAPPKDEQLVAILMEHDQAYQAIKPLPILPVTPKETGELEAPMPPLPPSPLLPAEAEDAPKAPLPHEQPDKSPAKHETSAMGYMGPMTSSCNAANPPAHLRRAKPLRVRRSSSSSTASKHSPLAQPTVPLPLPLPRISFDTPLPVISPSKWYKAELWQAPVATAAQVLPAKQAVPNRQPLRKLASPHQSSRRLTEFSFKALAAQALTYLKKTFNTSKKTSDTSAAPIDPVNACAAAKEGGQSAIDTPPEDEQLTAILMDHGWASNASPTLPTLPTIPEETAELEAPTPLLPPSPLLPVQAEDAQKTPLAHVHEQPDKPLATLAMSSTTSTKAPMASTYNAAHPPNPPAHLRRAKPLRVRRSSSTAPKPAPLAQPNVPLPLPRISFDNPLPVISPSKWFNREQWEASVATAAQDLPAGQAIPNTQPLRKLASPHQSSRRLTGPLTAQAVHCLKQASKQTSAVPVSPVDACAAAKERGQSVIEASPPKDEQLMAILMEHDRPSATPPTPPKETGELDAPTPVLPQLPLSPPTPPLPAQVEVAEDAQEAPPTPLVPLVPKQHGKPPATPATPAPSTSSTKGPAKAVAPSTGSTGKPAAPPPPPPPSAGRKLSGAPMPPPPPPPAGRKSGATPTPPPPPLSGRKLAGTPPPPLSAGAKVLAGPAPKVKTKSFFWDKVPATQIPGSYWAAHPPKYDNFRQDEVEELFQAKQAATKAKVGGKAGKKMAALTMKRATAVGVSLHALRCPWRGIKAAIEAFDPAVFQTAEDVRTVIKCVPSEAEQGLLEAFASSGGRLDTLPEAELFCMDLMQIPRVRARLANFLVKFEGQENLGWIGEVLQMHLAAHAELRASPCFAAALEEALVLGNFLNHGSRLGGAAGFRLRNLPKLQDTRSLDSKTTLLQYIAGRLCAGEPACQPLLLEVPHLVQLHTSLTEAKELLDKVRQAMAGVDAELGALPPPVSVSLLVASQDVQLQLGLEGYQVMMLDVLEGMAKGVEATREMQARADSSLASLAAYYGENASAVGSLGDFLGPVTTFAKELTAVQNGIYKQRKEQEEREERRRQKAAAAASKQG